MSVSSDASATRPPLYKDWVRRDVSMDEGTGRAHDGLARVQGFVTDVVRRILAGRAGVARPTGL